MSVRLTKRVGSKVYINTDTIPRDYCAGDYGFQWCRFAKSCPSVRDRRCPVLMVLDKLAEYEDKDERTVQTMADENLRQAVLDSFAGAAPTGVTSYLIQDSGDRTTFETGAVRDMHEGKGRFDLLPMCVLMRLAKHYEAGSKKYGDRNWEIGIPTHSFADSAMRHLVKYMDGWNDEDHLIAAIWNLCGLAWTEEKRPEMQDIPARKGLENDR